VKGKSEQLRDDPQLLELMLQDTRSAPDLYKPTNYWLNYEKIFLPELRSYGLKNFRRRKDSVLSTFGATDLLPKSLHLNYLPVKGRERLTSIVLKKLMRALLKVEDVEKFFNLISLIVSGVTLQDVRLLCYEFAKCYGEKNGAKSIRDFEASLIGNPEDVFFIEGKAYTTSALYCYVQYAYCCRYIDFDSIDTMMEIGSGSGKQIEVIKKLHPHICFFVFDIPPTLYVCEQYLSTIFSDSVVSYRQTRKMRSVPKQHEGKIFIFGNWKLPELVNLKYDLFWNSASFQEMEPEVVLNYLKFVNQQTNKFVFLHEKMEGQVKAAKKGWHGVLKQVTLEHYKKGLKDFQLLNLTRAIHLPRIDTSYSFSFWERRNARNQQ